MRPDEADSEIDQWRALGHPWDADAPQGQAGALALAQEADHKGRLQVLPPLEPARPATAALTQPHRALPGLAERLDQQPEERLLLGVLRPYDGSLGEDRGRHRNRPAADDHRGHAPPSVVMPCRPVERDQ
jgi:hypothetical protein